MWKTEGVVIVVAGITQISLFVYDHVEKSLEIEEDLDIDGDIGSYLGVMDMIKKSDDSENYYIFAGTTEGTLSIFELGFTINYHENILDLGEIAGGLNILTSQ